MLGVETPLSEQLSQPDNELLRALTAELTALEESGAGLPLVFHPIEAFYLLALLQLALRHPGVLDGVVATFGRSLAENLEERLGRGGPAITEVARRGWQPQHDLPRNRADG